MIDDRVEAGGGPGPAGHPGAAVDPATRVLAVVKDLFFVARIRETARLVGVPLALARSAEELVTARPSGVRLVLLDLTSGVDCDAVLSALERLDPAARPPVVAFTTHALAKQTQRWHARCDRVVTKETLTQELSTLLREGLAR